MSSDQITEYINECFKNIVDNTVKAFKQLVIKKCSFGQTYELKNQYHANIFWLLQLTNLTIN